jgi:predicted RNA-binding protein YlxR (DUF448 family)
VCGVFPLFLFVFLIDRKEGRGGMLCLSKNYIRKKQKEKAISKGLLILIHPFYRKEGYNISHWELPRPMSALLASSY